MSLYPTGQSHILKFLLGITACPHPPPPPRHHQSHVTDFTSETQFLSFGQLSQQRDRLGARLITDFRHRTYKQTISSSHSNFHPPSTGLKRLERETKLTPLTLEMRAVKTPTPQYVHCRLNFGTSHAHGSVKTREFRETTSCRLADTCQGFEEIWCFHLQSRRPCISR